MDYIESALGVKVKYQLWKHTAELPYYISDRYELQQVMIDSVKAVFLYPKSELDQIASVKKQIARIQALENLPVVIVMKYISRSRREYMISAKIPFIVPEKQLYLPFMGIALQERFKAEIPAVEKLPPSAQVLFFYYLYQKQTQIYMSEATRALGFSSMTITRAARQLEGTGLFTAKKDGVRKILYGNCQGRDLFEQMQPYLISPIRKIVYVKKQMTLPGAYLAGLSALSANSMINPPGTVCYAVGEENAQFTGTDILMDSDSQMEIQIWKYHPAILSGNGVVDTLSLVMTLKDNSDERIEDAVSELLAHIWEDKNGCRIGEFSEMV